MADRHATESETATQQWVQRWIRLTPILDEMAESSADTAPLRDIIPQFNDAFRSALSLHPPEPWSGLIEQQAIFRRVRR